MSACRRTGLGVLHLIAGVLLGCVIPFVLTAAAQDQVGTWLLNTFPVIHVGEFICGLLLALALKEGLWMPLPPWAAVGAFLTCYVLLPMAPSWVPQRTVFLAAIPLVIAALARADLDGVRTVARSRMLVRLGGWSYCFSLVDQMTLQITLFVCAKTVPAESSDRSG